MSSQHDNHDKRLAEKRIIRTVKKTIVENSMFKSGDHVLVAVSGGPDSLALIHLLDTLSSFFSFRLAIAHLNHCLRQKESERDAEFVAALARKLNLPVYMEKQDVRQYQRRHKLSLEEAARRVRYTFLNQVAEANGFNKIALGHHYDDNAELLLMYLLRGSGPLGLSGIPPVRDRKIVRPLINVKRSEIIDYLTEKELEYVSDTSNADLNYLRNKLRHDLIPQLLSSYNPKIRETLNRTASIIRSEEEWIEALIDPIFKNTLICQEDDKICLSREGFEQIPLAARRRLIRKAILTVKGNLRRITYAHIDATIRLAMTGPAVGFLDLPDRIRIQRNHQVLLISKEKENLRTSSKNLRQPICPAYEYRITPPGRFHIKEAGAYLKFSEMGIKEITDFGHTGQQIAFFDINKLRIPLIVRNFRPGDRFSPLGMTGTQKVKTFFINNKIPREQRAKCPFLVSSDKIIWVVGHRLDNSVKVSAETRKVLKAEVLLA
jgi:tRNA(Ile)-lysidine synthase